MGYRLRGGRPKNMRQGIYWVQRHRDNTRRQRNKIDTNFNLDRSGPDAIGWIFIIGIALLLSVFLA